MLKTGPDCWCSILTASQATTAVNIVREVASRLRERKQIETAIAAATQQTEFPRSVRWQDHSVAQGYAGLAIMCSNLNACFPDEDWDVVGHSLLETAVRDAEQQPYLQAGMCVGLSGLAFASWCLSQGGKRYRKLQVALEEQLLPQTVVLANNLAEQKENVSVSQFDLISGLSSIGAYLLSRKEVPEVAEAIKVVLRSLVELTKEEGGLPRWYTPVSLVGDEESQRLYPNGNLNCGLAHGIPGPLGLLSLAHLSNITVDGMEEAIHRVAMWLLGHSMKDPWGINWPASVPVEAGGTMAATSSTEVVSPWEPSRAAWCYGSPGLARSLWFAGKALGHAEYCEIAIAALEAVFRRPLDVRRIDSPTFCHGVAGLLQITLRFAHDTGLPQFTEAARTLSEQLLSLYRPDTLLGYYNLEKEGKRVDQPSLLDGAAGVVMVLLAAATSVEPTWDRMYLLS
jgi:hypothetical protein